MTQLLTNKQLSSLLDGLQSLEGELTQLLEATAEGTKPVKLKDNQGRLSRMDELHNQSILVANRNVARNRLKSVRQALVRIKEGYYGICAQCDEPIAFARLNAYPDAQMCINCQSASETL